MANKNFVLRIDEALLNEIHNLAKAREVTMADLVRGIIMDYLSGDTAPQKPDPPKDTQEEPWWM